jgi:hypothetical protein
MIWESSYWKKEILKIADKLERRITQKKWFDASNANAEKEIMVSAFMVRKLFESKKIDDTIERKTIPIIKYPSNGKKISLLRRLSPERFFTLEVPNKSKITIKDIYNNIIHSYIFMLNIVDGEFQYFWVASDWNKFAFMLQINVIDYISILREVGNYFPKAEGYFYDDKKEDYIVIRNEKKLEKFLEEIGNE